MNEYNAQARAFQERYGPGFDVARLQKARHRGLLMRVCVWPDFAPVVMPLCDVVVLTSFERGDGKRSEPHILGYVSQQALLKELGDRVSRCRTPVRHLVVEEPVDGDGQYRLLRHVHPDLKTAAAELLEEA